MRVLFDTNVLLDALLAREPFVADAAFLLETVELGQVEGFMSATTVTDIHYLVYVGDNGYGYTLFGWTPDQKC